jgi:signal transduction histidine kinase
MATVDLRSAALNERYLRAQDLLTTVRAQVLIGSLYVLDTLLDTDPIAARAGRDKLEDAYGAADRSLQQYVPIVDDRREAQRIARLRSDISDFHAIVARSLSTRLPVESAETRALVEGQILVKREAVVRAADDVQAQNRAAFVRQQSDIASEYRATQRRLWGSFGLAVLVSFGIALLATFYASRLEDRINGQRLKEIENAWNVQRLSRLLITAQEEERRAISRELHDEVGQALTAIKVELAVAQRAIEGAGGSAHVLDDVRSISDGALNAVRDLSHLLHPAVLDDVGLAAAVNSYTTGFAKRHEIRVEVAMDGLGGRCNAETEVAAYRIVQEALTNVARHGHASVCRVHLDRRGPKLLVIIEDNGIGFDVSHGRDDEPRTGLGLIGIRERVARLGGRLELESASGHGTRLTVELPVCDAAPDQSAAEESESIIVAARAIHEAGSG